MTCAEKILQLRKERGYTQEQLAERLGVSRQAVSRWESGQTMPEASVLKKLCDTFNVSSDYLLFDSVSPDSAPAAEWQTEPAPQPALSMTPVTSQERLQPWMGAAVLVLVILATLVFGVKLQTAFGPVGLIATELIFALVAFVYCLVRRLRFSEIFPIRRVSAGDVCGSLCLSAAVFFAITVLTMLWSLVLPAELKAEAESIDSILYSDKSSYLYSLAALVIFAPICEEAVHRGVIFSHFRGMKKPWAVIAVMALFFGLFHMSVLRFWGTALLGAVITYVMIKKNNFVLAVVMHAFSNLLSAILQLYPAAAAPLLLVGIIISPILFAGGIALLDRAESRKKLFFRAGLIPSLALAVLIGGISLSGVLGPVEPDRDTIFDITCTVGEEAEDVSGEFEIENDGIYTLSFSLKSSGGTYRFVLSAPDGSSVIDMEGADWFENEKDAALSAGTYSFALLYVEGCEGQSVSARLFAAPRE